MAMNLAAFEIKAFVPAADFGVSDPRGVVWRIAQNLPRT
jgi:hypothetical protein